MTEPQFKDDKESKATLAGSILMVFSLTVIGCVALPIVRWRDPVSGNPLPRMIAIFTPVLAGALFCAIGTGILKMLGIPVAKPKKELPTSDEKNDDKDSEAQRQDKPFPG